MGEAAPGENPWRTAGLSHLVQVAELQGVGKSPGGGEEWLKPKKNPSRHQAGMSSLVLVLPYILSELVCLLSCAFIGAFLIQVVSLMCVYITLSNALSH